MEFHHPVFLRIGNTVINLNNVSLVELALTRQQPGKTEPESFVRVYYAVPPVADSLVFSDFHGRAAEILRCYFDATVNPKGVIHPNISQEK